MPPRKKNRDPYRRAVLAPRIVPASVPVCLCADLRMEHDWDEDAQKFGRCLKKVCGCKVYRPRIAPEVA